MTRRFTNAFGQASWRWLNTDKAGCQAQDYFTANAYWAEKDSSGNFLGYKTGVMGMTGNPGSVGGTPVRMALSSS